MSITSRVDAITALGPDYARSDPPCPRSVKIELTARCNFACSFCARSMRLRDQGDMARHLFERLAIEMRDAGVEELGLFYLGESFLVDWLPDAIRFAKVPKPAPEDAYPYVFLTTNGSLATPERVYDCMVAGLDSLKFSLNYADQDQFKSIANVKGDLYSRILENLKAAHGVRDTVERATGHRCGLYASYIAYDGEQGAKMAAVVEDVRPLVDEIYALPLYNQAALTGGEGERRGWNVTAGNRGRLDALREPLPCWSIFTEGHVTWDGRLSACCFDHAGRFDMGDLKTTPFMAAWHSEKFQALRRAHLVKCVAGTVCERCIAYG